MLLSVATDRIAHPAMRCAALLARLARDGRVAARRQPYDTARTAGGSSGGTGAAITGLGLVLVPGVMRRQQVLAPSRRRSRHTLWMWLALFWGVVVLNQERRAQHGVVGAVPGPDGTGPSETTRGRARQRGLVRRTHMTPTARDRKRPDS
jgi:hypothetical protein